MENTTNYSLRKYQSGDLFNPLTVNNPNLDDIDTDMKAISDRAIGRATELVSQGVHAITVLDTDCKTIKWVATANFTAGETFTINGIQCNAYLPSGEALGTNAYVSGAQVIGSLNNDNSAITIYVPQGSVAVASDSERLGGELPSYYATKDYADGIKSTADNSASLIQKKALVNTYYDSSVNKLYVINADGSVGGEINMGGKSFDYANQQIVNMTSGTSITCGGDGEFFVCGTEVGSSYGLLVNNHYIGGATNVFTANTNDSSPLFKVKSGDIISHDGSLNNASKKIVFIPYL